MRSTSGAARGASSGTRARPPATSSGCDSFATTATATRCSRWSSRPVRPATPASARCFYRDLDGGADPQPGAPPAEGEPAPAAHEALARLERTLIARKRDRPPGSYTVELLDDPERIGEKVREEADEVARAAAGESDERVAEEAADVLYHLEVLLLSREVPLAAALERLNDRRR